MDKCEASTPGIDKLDRSEVDPGEVRDEAQEPGSTAIGYAFRNRKILNTTWSK